MSEQNYREIFDEAMNQLHEEYQNSGRGDQFKLWFNFDYVEDTISTITISAPSAFMQMQMQKRGNIEIVRQKICELSGQNIEINCIVINKTISSASASEESSPKTIDQEKTSPAVTPSVTVTSEPVKKETKKHPQLRDDYIFENFIPGENSEYAYNASLAAAKNPGKAYNPILIYGGVGLGKTHLMESIGNYIYSENSKLKICYISAESMMNEFYNAIQKKETEEFKKKYRTLDVLLLDDIHFLQDKKGLQEELFYTFNALYDRNCQMVFTCDRPINELKSIEERLRTRFSRGLNIDLQPPNYETRRAILQNKLSLKGKFIPDDVIDYIAKNVQTNVRDLESCLTTMLAYSELVGKELTVQIAQEQLRDTFSSPLSGTITVDVIQKVVADHYAVSISDIKGKKKDKKIVLPRQIAMYIARQLTECSTTDLGNEFGGRDHTTVMHSVDKVEQQMKINSSLDSTVQLLIRSIKDYKK